MANKQRLAVERQERILQEIRAVGAVRVSSLVDLLGVSDMTVRRDIGELAELGLVRKVHGGAVEVPQSRIVPGAGFASASRLAQKLAIADAAIQLIRPGSAIALSAGTTSHVLATRIVASPHLRPLTVFTNSLPVADCLHSAGDRELDVLLSGGSRTPDDALIGPVPVAALENFRFDQLFLGVHAIGPGHELTTPILLEGETDRAMIASANQLVVIADSTKWRAASLSVVAPMSAVDVLITDDGLERSTAEEIEKLVGRLVLVHAAQEVESEQ